MPGDFAWLWVLVVEAVDPEMKAATDREHEKQFREGVTAQARSL